MSKTFALPDLGEGIHEAQVIRIMVQPGETVAEDQPLVEVETDKAAVEIPSPFAGVAAEIHVSEGQTIEVGDAVVTFDGVAGTASEAPESSSGSPRPAPVPAPVPPPASAPASAGASAPSAAVEVAPAPPRGGGRTKVAAAPAVRKRARDLGVDIDTVTGTGPGGRVTREDLERHVAGAASAARGGTGAPATPPTGSAAPSAPVAPSVSRIAPMPTEPPPGSPGRDAWGTIHTAPLSQIRKTIARQMATSAFTIPHVTHGDEADVTVLERLRKELNAATGASPKLTLMAFLIRATSIALRKFPIFNATFDTDHSAIVYKDYVNIGVAVDTDRGLVVPNIRNADALSITGAAVALQGIADAARANRFAIEDLRGGTFTITNVGPLGGTFSTPIINHPEVAILGLGRIRRVPVFGDDDQVRPALMLPLFVAFDHRAADGLAAAKFAHEIIGMLEHPATMLLY